LLFSLVFVGGALFFERRAVALLELLARAARTRIVATDARSGDRGTARRLLFLPRGCACRVERRHRIFGLGAGMLRDDVRELLLVGTLGFLLARRDLFLLLGLRFEELYEHVARDLRHHVQEEVEPFFLVLVLRIALSVSAQADAVAQVLHVREVIHPG